MKRTTSLSAIVFRISSWTASLLMVRVSLLAGGPARRTLPGTVEGSPAHVDVERPQELSIVGCGCGKGERMQHTAHAAAERVVDHLVLLDPALALEGAARDARLVVVAIAGEVPDLDGGVGKLRLDEALDLAGLHGHGQGSGLVRMTHDTRVRRHSEAGQDRAPDRAVNVPLSRERQRTCASGCTSRGARSIVRSFQVYVLRGGHNGVRLTGFALPRDVAHRE